MSSGMLISKRSRRQGVSAGCSAMTRAINQYARANNLQKDKDPALTGDDVREGLVAVISVKLPNPRFSSQTKEKLVNNEIEGVVSSVVYDGLMRFLEENPAVAKRPAALPRVSHATRAPCLSVLSTPSTR